MTEPLATEQTSAFLLVDNEIVKKTYEEHRFNEESAKRVASESEDLLKKYFDEAGDDLTISKITSIPGTNAEKVTQMVKVHSTLTGAHKALSEKGELDVLSKRIREGNLYVDPRAVLDTPSPIPVSVYPQEPNGLDDIVFAALEASGQRLNDVGRKPIAIDIPMHNRGEGLSVWNTLFATSAGWSPFVTRMPGFVPDAQRPIQVIDAIPSFPTTQHSVKYMEETTFTSTAAEILEGAASPEAALALTEQTESIRKISEHIPVTEEQLEDEGQVRSYLTRRLPFMVRQRLDAQLINGNGTAPNLSGILARTGLGTKSFVRASSKLVKPFNTILQAKTDVVLTGRAMASHAFLHHSLWEALALQESTAGGYYLGSPATDFNLRVWGLPVVLTDHLSIVKLKSAGIVGDFVNYSDIAVRKDMTIEFGLSADDFLKGQIRIKASVRVGLLVYRPAAFVKLDMPDGSGLI